MEHLNREKIDYAITGAVAVSYYGIPRTTLDADFIVHISSTRTWRFFRRLRDMGIEADPDKVHRQLKSGYNVVTVTDRLSPHTADLMVVRRTPEKREGKIQGVNVFFQSPESLILAKLRMIKVAQPVGRTEKDRDDIRGILANTRVNREEIVKRARRESTLEIFKQTIMPRPALVQ